MKKEPKVIEMSQEALKGGTVAPILGAAMPSILPNAEIMTP